MFFFSFDEMIGLVVIGVGGGGLGSFFVRFCCSWGYLGCCVGVVGWLL